ncbi:MAG: hypothetical protein U0694_12050 [Anaerolineae bacterium]
MDEQLERIFTKYPKLRAVAKALDEYEAGEPITSRCMVCGEILTVTHIEIESTGTVNNWVVCPNGCTTYHEQGKKVPSR